MGIVAFSQTTIPPASTWTPARNIINANFVNTYDSIAASRLRVNILYDSVLTHRTAINLRLLKSDTASMLANYTRNGELNSTLAAKVNISDTAAMLSPYALTSELGEFGSGSGDVIGSDTVTAYRLAIFSGVDAITGYPTIYTSTASGNTTLYTDRGRFGSAGDTLDNWGGRHANSVRLYNKEAKIGYPNLLLYGSYVGTGLIGIKDSIIAFTLGQYMPEMKFTIEKEFNRSLVPLYTPVSTTSLAGFRIPHGVAPSSPTNGDLWTTTGGIFIQINGSTDTLATQEYARQYGGTGTVTISDVQNEIADSLNAIRPSIAVGDGTVGPFFDGSEDGGQILYFYGDNGFYTALQGGAPTANRLYRLPIAALPSAGHKSYINIDEYGNMGFIDTTLVGTGSGTVSSVGLTMPTGFSVSSSPVTTSGTLGVSFSAGYSLPTDVDQANWTTAYGWGDWSTQGFLTGTDTLSLDARVALLEADYIDSALLNTIVPLLSDTVLIASYMIGWGHADDTILFSTGDILGGFYWDGSDSLVVTSHSAVVYGSSPDIDVNWVYDVNWRDATPTDIFTSNLTVTSTTTPNIGTTVSSGVIPSGRWIWAVVRQATAQPTQAVINLYGNRLNRTY